MYKEFLEKNEELINKFIDKKNNLEGLHAIILILMIVTSMWIVFPIFAAIMQFKLDTIKIAIIASVIFIALNKMWNIVDNKWELLEKELLKFSEEKNIKEIVKKLLVENKSFFNYEERLFLVNFYDKTNKKITVKDFIYFIKHINKLNKNYVEELKLQEKEKIIINDTI